MRWADLDSLNHVNNVVYVDYAAESRAILIEDGIVGADERVQRMSVDFLRPLLLSSQSVRVTSTRDGDELVQEITNGVADTVYARVTTAFGAPVDVKRGRATFDPYPLRVRHSDVDATGVASLTKAFEFFQEARIGLFSSAIGVAVMLPMSLSSATAAAQAIASVALMPFNAQLGVLAPIAESVLRVRSSLTKLEAVAVAKPVGSVTSSTK